MELQVLLDGKILIQGKMPWHIADPSPYLAIVTHHVQPDHRRGTRVREGQGGQDPEQGGLPRSVRADEAEQLTFPDVEAYVPQGFDRLVGLAYIFNLYRSVSVHGYLLI